MADPGKKHQVDLEEIASTGSATHCFSEEDFEEELALDADEDDDDTTVEDG